MRAKTYHKCLGEGAIVRWSSQNPLGYIIFCSLYDQLCGSESVRGRVTIGGMLRAQCPVREVSCRFQDFQDLLKDK